MTPVLLLLCCLLLLVMLMFITTTWAESATLTAVIAYAFFYGGFGQMVAGVFEVGVPAAVLLLTLQQLFRSLRCHQISLFAAELKYAVAAQLALPRSGYLGHVACVPVTPRGSPVPI